MAINMKKLEQPKGNTALVSCEIKTINKLS